MDVLAGEQRAAVESAVGRARPIGAEEPKA
jgi:hypothetical protein